MAKPPMEIYQFEDQLEQAVASVLLANGVNEAAKQRDYQLKLEDGTVRNLKAPRVEPKYICNGLNANEHYYVAPQTGTPWLDIASGMFYLKVVTRRDDKAITHAYLRGLCRYLMQSVSAISDKMKYHKIEKMIETASSSTLDTDKLHDISALSFNCWLRIRSEFFPIT